MRLLVVLALASVSLLASGGARAEGPTPTAPTGAPAFRVDLASAFGEGPMGTLPYGFAGGERPRIFLYEEWSELTEHFLRARIHDPSKQKDVEIFGPLVESAAGAGEKSTPAAKRKKVQAALDKALGAERYRPASVSDTSDAEGRVTAPVAGLAVKLDGAALIATFEAGGELRTRTIPLTVPKLYRNICDIRGTFAGVARIHYDDSVPFAVADVALDCESMDGDARVPVPVVIDLRPPTR
ncbi:MAG: hypothetical protein IT385_17540 [Deltaproteobacteria bacterium]|nr:hypothetical protein [Deltaproteobacteria bacterium]